MQSEARKPKLSFAIGWNESECVDLLYLLMSVFYLTATKQDSEMYAGKDSEGIWYSLTG